MDFEQYLKQELENDVALREEFDALQPEYEIIRKLIEARVELGLTQKELAKKCGIKQSNISRLERGKANPTIGFLKRLAKALEADLIVEFRKKEYSSESVAVPQVAPAVTVTIGFSYAQYLTPSTFNEIKTTRNHLINAGT